MKEMIRNLSFRSLFFFWIEICSEGVQRGGWIKTCMKCLPCLCQLSQCNLFSCKYSRMSMKHEQHEQQARESWFMIRYLMSKLCQMISCSYYFHISCTCKAEGILIVCSYFTFMLQIFFVLHIEFYFPFLHYLPHQVVGVVHSYRDCLRIAWHMKWR